MSIWIKTRNQFANEWSVLGILFGLLMAYVYYGYSCDIIRSWLLGTGFVIASILVFNLAAFLYPDAYKEGVAAIIGFLAFQAVLVLILAVVFVMVMVRLPYTPPGEWTTLPEPPQKVVNLVDSPFEEVSQWMLRGQTINGDIVIYICHHELSPRCQWLSEEAHAAENWDQLIYSNCLHEIGEGGRFYTPKQPANIIDQHIRFSCGADVHIRDHYLLTDDGTIWHWRFGDSALTYVGLAFLWIASIGLIIAASIIVNVFLLVRYRYRKRGA